MKKIHKFGMLSFLTLVMFFAIFTLWQKPAFAIDNFPQTYDQCINMGDQSCWQVVGDRENGGCIMLRADCSGPNHCQTFYWNTNN